MDLMQKKCVPCKGGEPTATDDQIRQWLPYVLGWSVTEVDGVKRLVKTFKFKNFLESISFINKIKNVAEAEGHHPDIHISWNKVQLASWTHAIRGLHENDFILAAKIDRIV